jgi:hypothetical protein
MDVYGCLFVVDIGGYGIYLRLYGFIHRLIPHINWHRALKNSSGYPEGC